MKGKIRNIVRRRIKDLNSEIKRPISDIIAISEMLLSTRQESDYDKKLYKELQVALMEFDKVLAKYKDIDGGYWPVYYGQTA